MKHQRYLVQFRARPGRCRIHANEMKLGEWESVEGYIIDDGIPLFCRD